jgi:small subunit ribosomal protein S8
VTMVSDPISDMLARIRNAQIARLERTDIPLSKLKRNVAELLKREGYVADVSSEAGTPGKLTVVLKYGQGHQGAIAGMKRRSRPGRRLYVGHTELPKVMNGLGIAILSTSRGVMTDKDARREQVGGELLCEVW